MTIRGRLWISFTILSILCLCSLARSSTANAAGSARSPVAGALIGPRAAQSSVVVISSQVDQTVGVFSSGGLPIASISAPSPTGVALDRAGDVYIGQPGQGVLVYENDYKTLLLTLKLGIDGRYGAYPDSVAVDRGSGIVGVTTTVNGPGYVLFFKPGSARPCNIVSLPTPGSFWGAFDAAGRYYISAPGYVGLITGPCIATSIQSLTTAKSMFNKAVKITPAGDVAFFVEQSATKVFIYTYSPPVNGSLGAPISITPLLRFDVPAFNGIAFSPDGTSVWLANNSKGALKYAYPTGGLPIQPIKVNDAYDVIVGP